MEEKNINKKRDRFKRIATKRTQKILKTLKLLGNCANKSNYEYNQEEVDKIFRAIEDEIATTKSKFKVHNKDKEIDFKL